MKHSIAIVIDDECLGGKTDAYIAQCWHVAQANPAPHGNRDAGALAETIGREIIRRWLASPVAEPALYHHQGNDYAMRVLREHGHWPGPNHDKWVFEPAKAERVAGESQS